MFVFECAARLSCLPELLRRPIDEIDMPAVSSLLRGSSNRCPGSASKATSAQVAQLVARASKRRDDALLGMWSLAREEILEGVEEEAQQLWLAEIVRRSFPREAIKALLGLGRAEMLGLIGCPEVIHEVATQREAGLSDNHLHSGAADELGSILQRLVPRVVEVAEPRGLAKTAGRFGSSELNAGALVLALAAACASLADAPDCSEQSDLGEDWWAQVADAVKAGSRLDESLFRELRRSVDELSMAAGFFPQLSDLYVALEEIAAGENLSKERQQGARRGLICLALLHGLVAVPPDSDLGIFVPRFKLMQSIRDLFEDDRGRIESALTTMYRESGVTAVELRKSLTPTVEGSVSVATIKEGIDSAIVEHASEAAKACRELELDELTVRMPVTFTRLDMKAVDTNGQVADFVPYREPIAETMAVADAIVCATDDDLISRFVGAVDVVGDEKKVANWVYAVAYQRIAGSERGLEFACHAGEYFSDQIEGVRRVAEVALFEPARVRRIGHCLSLGVDQGIDGGPGRYAEALLENSIWALMVLEGREEVRLGQAAPQAPARLKRELKNLISDLADLIFGRQGVSVVDMRKWYVERFDLSVVARWIPDLAETVPNEGYAWSRGTPLSSLEEPRNLRDAMMAATIYDRPFSVSTASGIKKVRYKPDAQVPGDLRERLSAALAEAGELVVEPVREWLKAREIVIESCPSSNIALVGLAARSHPVWEFHRQGLLCSINTDDPALFGASLKEEYVYAGMVSTCQGGDGEEFVAGLAGVSRGEGMIERPLCDAELPVDAYRKLAPA